MGDGVSPKVTVIKHPPSKSEDKKPFAQFTAHDEKEGGRPLKIVDFAGEGVKGRNYTNQTKDGAFQHNALFRTPDHRIVILTVASKDRGKTTDSTTDTFLRSFSLGATKK